MKNLLFILKNKKSLIILISILLIFQIIGFILINIQDININYGSNYTIINIILHEIFSIIFAVFISTVYYKFQVYNKQNKSTNIFGGIGSTIALIITGCPVCGITFMSILGIAPFLNLLPWSGIELKLLGIILVWFATDYNIRNLKQCSTKLRGGILPNIKQTIIYLIIIIVSIISLYFILNKQNFVYIKEYNINIKLPKEYTIFMYDLEQGCSDTDTILEFFGPKQNIMIKNITISTLKTLEDLEECKADEKILTTFSKKSYYKYKSQRDTQQTQIQQIQDCEDFSLPYCIEHNFILFKEENLINIKLQHTSEYKIEKNTNTQEIQKKLEKELQKIKIY